MSSSVLLNGMSGFQHTSPIEDVKNFYSAQAETYDELMDVQGYVAAKNSTEKLVTFLAKTGSRKDIRIMDLGLGTGKVGEILKEHGYDDIDGEDISPGMVEVAQKKGIYKKILCEGLGDKPLSVEDETYDVVVAVGIFTVGHVKSSSFDEALRIAKKGGLVVFTVRNDAFLEKSYGYGDKIEELCKTKKWEVLENNEIGYLLAYRPELRNARFYICKKL